MMAYSGPKAEENFKNPNVQPRIMKYDYQRCATVPLSILTQSKNNKKYAIYKKTFMEPHDICVIDNYYFGQVIFFSANFHMYEPIYDPDQIDNLTEQGFLKMKDWSNGIFMKTAKGSNQWKPEVYYYVHACQRGLELEFSHAPILTYWCSIMTTEANKKSFMVIKSEKKYWDNVEEAMIFEKMNFDASSSEELWLAKELGDSAYFEEVEERLKNEKKNRDPESIESSAFSSLLVPEDLPAFIGTWADDKYIYKIFDKHQLHLGELTDLLIEKNKDPKIPEEETLIPEYFIRSLFFHTFTALEKLWRVYHRAHCDIRPDHITFNFERFNDIEPDHPRGWFNRSLTKFRIQVAPCNYSRVTNIDKSNMMPNPPADGEKNDIWSLALIILEMVNQKYPFGQSSALLPNGKDLRSKVPQIDRKKAKLAMYSTNLHNFFANCLVKGIKSGVNGTAKRWGYSELVKSDFWQDCLENYMEDKIKSIYYLSLHFRLVEDYVKRYWDFHFKELIEKENLSKERRRELDADEEMAFWRPWDKKKRRLRLSDNTIIDQEEWDRLKQKDFLDLGKIYYKYKKINLGKKTEEKEEKDE